MTDDEIWEFYDTFLRFKRDSETEISALKESIQTLEDEITALRKKIAAL